MSNSNKKGTAHREPYVGHMWSCTPLLGRKGLISNFPFVKAKSFIPHSTVSVKVVGRVVGLKAQPHLTKRNQKRHNIPYGWWLPYWEFDRPLLLLYSFLVHQTRDTMAWVYTNRIMVWSETCRLRDLWEKKIQ